MNSNVIITCAVTGGSDTAGRNPNVPVTPEQIANSAIEAARVGAAIVHCHVRDPETGKASRDVALFRELVERIRDSDTDVLINLTAGIGGDWVPRPGAPSMPGEGTDMIGPEDRLAHVLELKPDICTLDCGTLNFGDGDMIYISTPPYLRRMASLIKGAGVKPELEVFDLGHIRFVKQMIAEGLIQDPPMMQICLGIPWGAPADSRTMMAMAESLPGGAVWAGFGISRQEMPLAAQAMLLGGHIRVGLEDNLYLDRGVLATNATLVARAAEIVRLLGGSVASVADARRILQIGPS